jgi:hypothetical protein
MNGLDCYGSSDDAEVEAKTVVQAVVHSDVEMVHMASHPAAVARVAARAASVVVSPIARPAVDAAARATDASKRLAMAPPIPRLGLRWWLVLVMKRCLL